MEQQNGEAGERKVARWSGVMNAAENGGFVAYGDYLTLKRDYENERRTSQEWFDKYQEAERLRAMIADHHLRSNSNLAPPRNDGEKMEQQNGEAGDLEILRACAIAMGIDLRDTSDGPTVFISGLPNGSRYDPLHDDAQCFALVKKFKLDIEPCFVGDDGEWEVSTWDVDIAQRKNKCRDADLNRAICLCVQHLSGTLPTA